MEFWLIVALGGGVAGFVQGMVGFGFGLASLGIWSWVLPPEIVVPAVVFGSLVGQLLASIVLRQGFRWQHVFPFLLGGTLGVPVGLWMLSQVDPVVFKFGVGMLLFAYCTIMLLINRLPRITHGGNFANGVIGWFGGVMSGFGGLPGPVPTLWCTLRGWSKQQQRQVFQSFYLFMHALTLVALGMRGMITTEVAQVFLAVGPAVLLPAMLGIRLYHRFSEKTFKTLVLVLLAASGLVLTTTTAPVVWRTLLAFHASV